MAYDELLAERLRAAVLRSEPRGDEHLDERKMFGGVTLLVNGCMAGGVIGRDLVVRTGAATDRALARPRATDGLHRQATPRLRLPRPRRRDDRARARRVGRGRPRRGPRGGPREDQQAAPAQPPRPAPVSVAPAPRASADAVVGVTAYSPAMRIGDIDAEPFHALEYLDAARGGGSQLRQLPLLRGRVEGLNGKLLGAPHFDRNPCLNLGTTPLQSWNGLLFSGKRKVAQDLVNLCVLKDFDFSGYLLDRVQIDHYNCNWKTFIEVYLEDYHVDPFHPGLGHFVNTEKLEWEFGDWYSVQTIAIDNARLQKPGSPVYAQWHKQVLQQTEGEMPPYGAIWLLYYPNIMLEWYPHTLVISTILPTGVESCINVVEFYYPEEIALFERDFVEAEQAAYKETALSLKKWVKSLSRAATCLALSSIAS